MPGADNGTDRAGTRVHPGEFDRRLLAPMILGSILNPVNSSIIAVSLVPIGVAFGAPPSATAWLVSGLYLATAIGQPVVGRLVDGYGPRRPYLVGSALVAGAGVLGALAPSLPVLVLARVLLGFGTCAGYPAAMSLIRGEGRRTGRDSPAGVLTVLAVCTQTIAVIGPPAGGLLIGLAGWRATLAVNIPLGLAALVLGTPRLPTTKRTGTPRPPSAKSVDEPGRRTNLDPRLLTRNRPLLLTYGRAVLAYLVSYAFLYGYTQWLEDGRGLSPSTAGLLQLPLFGTGILVSVITGRRNGFRGKLAVAGAGQLAVCVLLIFLGPTSPLGLLVLIALIFGIPQGLNSLALQNCVYHQSDPAHTGASAGLLRTFSYLGAILASTIQGAFYRHGAGTAGLHHLATFMLVTSVLLLVLTLADPALNPAQLISKERTDSP
jgi:MFS family permease